MSNSATSTRAANAEVDCWDTRIFNFSGNVAVSLPEPLGTRGVILAVREEGNGQVRYTVDGTAPTVSNGSQVQGNSMGYNPMPLADVSLFTVVGTAAGSEGSVEYKVLLC